MAEGKEEKSLKFWGVYTGLCFRFGYAGFFLSLASGLCFLILYLQGLLQSTLFVAMIICASFALVFLLALLLGYYGRYRLNHPKEK